MAIDSVNNNVNNNALLYAGGAALAGGVAGGTVGYYTKSILKDGQPTDSFVKKVSNNMVKLMPSELVAGWSKLEPAEINSMDDVRAYNINMVKSVYSKLSLDEAKKGMIMSIEVAQQAGETPMNAEEIMKAQSLDELFEIVAKNVDENLAGKNIDEIKAALKVPHQEQLKNKVLTLLDGIYDFNKKRFSSLKELGLDNIDADDMMGQFALKTRNAVVDAASSIKGKAALIYGGIAAAVAGTGTLLALNLNKSEEVSEPQE